MNDHRTPPWPHETPEDGEQRQACLVDRRSGFDRRRAYSLVYFANGGIERRRGQDRRKKTDRRQVWELRGTPCPVTSG